MESPPFRLPTQISASYLDWPTFSALAGDDFEDRYWGYADPGDGSEGEVPGMLALDAADDTSDSALGFEAAWDYLDKHVAADSPWRPFVEHAFTALIDDPEPPNDLGCAVDPELLAVILSPDTVRTVLEPTVGQPVPWGSAPAQEGAEIERWRAIWAKAVDRRLGLAYCIG